MSWIYKPKVQGMPRAYINHFMQKPRKHIRWRQWDYGADAAYFITICTKNRLPYFGRIHLELLDTNHPLLKELARKAPGTFQHSLQVANIAEAVINEIGGNELLIHVGALYHDVGKMPQHQYFIENMSKLDELTFLLVMRSLYNDVT